MAPSNVFRRISGLPLTVNRCSSRRTSFSALRLTEQPTRASPASTHELRRILPCDITTSRGKDTRTAAARVQPRRVRAPNAEADLILGRTVRRRWGRASALQTSVDACPAGSRRTYSGCPEWRGITPSANVRCLAAAPPVRARRSCACPHAAQHACPQRLGGTLPHSGAVGLLLLLPGCELRC